MMLDRMHFGSLVRISARGLGALFLGLLLVGCAGTAEPKGVAPRPAPTLEPGAKPTPEPTTIWVDPLQYVNSSIEAEVTLDLGGMTRDATSCPAKVSLSFTPISPSGKDIYGKDVPEMAHYASMWARCTDREYSAFDATGTFDGSHFNLQQGALKFTGDFDGTTTATLTGGEADQTFIFPIVLPVARPSPTH